MADQPKSFQIILATQDPEIKDQYTTLLKKEKVKLEVVSNFNDLLDQINLGAFDLLLLDESLSTQVDSIVLSVKEASRRIRIVLLSDQVDAAHRKLLLELPIHACIEKKEVDEKILVTLDATLKSLPKIDLISEQFEKIKQQIRVSEKNKEGLRYIIAAMPETITRLQPLDKFVKGIMTQICGFLDAEDSFLAMRDEKNELVLVVGTGKFDLTEREFYKSGFFKAHKDEIHKALEESRTTTKANSMLIPLRAKDRPLGVYYLEKAKGELEALEEDMLKLFASQAAITIDNSNLFQQASQDSLTGLYVRRYFFERFSEIMMLASRMGGQSIAVILCDIDHFKKINDTYGHQKGDEVLIAVADELKNNVRGTDVVGRLGGEEFAIILPGTDMKQGENIANQIREKVKELQFESEEGAFQLSMSFGVSAVQSVQIQPDQITGESAIEFAERIQKNLIGFADEALYESKESGRDRVTVGKMVESK